jgi:hypothetical protein
MERKVREERQGKIEGIEGIRRTGAHHGRRIGVEMPAGMRSSGDKIRQPGGAISRECRGEMERRERGFIGVAGASSYAGSKGGGARSMATLPAGEKETAGG